MAQAFLYLGVAYVGLDRSETAKGKFQEALRLDPELRVGEEHFSAKVVRVFEAARAEMAVRRMTGGAVDAAGRPASPRPRASPAPAAAARNNRSKAALIVLGVAGVGAGVGVAATRGGASMASPRPPTPAVTVEVSNGGGAITGVTVLTFTASATDLTSPTFNWTFGDGAVGTGTPIQHRFDAEGAFNVRLTATGAEGTATASGSVMSRTLTGRWSNQALPCPSGTFCWFNDLVQQGTTITGTWSIKDTLNREDFGRLINGTVSPPNQITFTQDTQCRRIYAGTVSSDLNTMTGTNTPLQFACMTGNETFRRE